MTIDNARTRACEAIARAEFARDKSDLREALGLTEDGGSIAKWEEVSEDIQLEYLSAAEPLADAALGAVPVAAFAGYDEETGVADDDGTMTANVDRLQQLVVGRRIVSARMVGTEFFLRLDNGKEVRLRDTSDCCAHTELTTFFRDPHSVDHVITGVGTTDEYTVWHIYADLGDILKMEVSWSEGTGYYGYGFEIAVIEDL